MLKNAYLLAKVGADTAENEQHFAENLLKIGNYRGPAAPRAGPAPRSPGRSARAWAPRGRAPGKSNQNWFRGQIQTLKYEAIISHNITYRSQYSYLMLFNEI